MGISYINLDDLNYNGFNRDFLKYFIYILISYIIYLLIQYIV